MSKKHRVLQELWGVLIALDLSAGDRLPAERTLAERLNVSRNTLRGILRTLEARGLVKIRPGSGCYLRARISGDQDNLLGLPPALEYVIACQLEAAYLVLPRVVELAAARIRERQLDELQRCSVDLSRSIFQGDTERIWNESLTFFRQVALGTGNDFLVRSVEQICSNDIAAYDHFFSLRREEREAIFADHVKILNALRARDKGWARQVAEDYFLRLCEILENRQGVEMTDLMSAILSERRELAPGEQA